MIWPRDQWSLTENDVELFNTVDDGLNDDVESIDRAMTVFRNLVTSRANRLLSCDLRRSRRLDCSPPTPTSPRRIRRRSSETNWRPRWA